MELLPIIFAKGRKPISYAIRLLTWSRWSHVAVLDGDMVIEAAGGVGVTVTPLNDFLARYTDTEIASIPCDSLERAYGRLHAQVGKPYDLWALFGILFRVGRWSNPDKWFCSELIAHASGLWRSNRNNRVSPEDIYKASK